MRKDIDYAIPANLLLKSNKKDGDTEVVKNIMDAYSKFSMQDMSLKEAQIEYLNILSQNEIMFGSYFQAEKLASLSHFVSDPLMLGNRRGKFRQS